MRVAVALTVAVLIAGCSQGSSGASGSPSPHPSLGTVGCASFPVMSTNQPKWLQDAGAGNNPNIPYVIASPAIAAAFLFANPLRAGHPNEPNNKILWVVGHPRNGSDLKVTAHPLGAADPRVTASFPDNSGPGEIYPSILDVPARGCWVVELRWAGNTAQIALSYA